MVEGSDNGRPATPRILVVEDSPLASALIVQVLQTLGFDDILCASDGLQAWGFFEDGKLFDLVICDWMMPKMNGLDVLKQLRASHVNIPFIMITAKKDDTAFAEAQFHGATAFIEKPYEVSELIDAVTQALQRSKDDAAGSDGQSGSNVWDI
jgi:CheY-like chemotaxis protein